MTRRMLAASVLLVALGRLTIDAQPSAVASAARGAAAQPPAGDWPQWRGPSRDGLSRDTGLLRTWPASGPPLLWTASGVGIGYSSMAVAGGRVYTLGARGENEIVIALDAATGKPAWNATIGRRFRNDRGDGPRSTPTVDGNRLYVLGSSGDLVCLDANTGGRIWTINVLRQFAGINPYWGLSESPLVHRDRVFVVTGGRAGSIIALRKEDGTVLWKSQGDEPGYSSPMIATVNGQEQAVFFTGSRALGLDVSDGRLLWSYARVSNGTANIATPVVRGDRVFLSSDYGTGAALLQLAPGGKATEVYFTREMRNHHASSVLVGEHLYGFSGSILTAMHFDSGKTVWRDRSVGKGSLVYADQRLYLFSEDGVAGLAEASPAGYREHGRFRIATTGRAPTWSHPVVAGGRLYLREQETIHAFDVRAH